MRRGVGARRQQQKQHRHHFVAADAPAFHFDPHQLGYQSLAAFLAGRLQALGHVAPHLPDGSDHAQEADDARELCPSLGPGDELRPVGPRQAQQLANHRQWQRLRIARNKVGRTSFGKQLRGKIIGDGTNARLHLEHGAAAEGLVDDAAQAGVVGLVGGQHVVGKRRDEGRHPPAQARDRPVVLP